MGTLNSWDVADANNNAAPPDGWPENTMAYSDVNDAGRAVQGTLKRYFADINGSLVGGGVADAYTVTLNETGYVAYFVGMNFKCSIPATNTVQNPTLNVNGIGAATIREADGSSMPVGALEAGGIYEFVYDGTEFRIMSQMAVLSSGVNSGQMLYSDFGAVAGASTIIFLDISGVGDMLTISPRSAQTGGNAVEMIAPLATFDGTVLKVTRTQSTVNGISVLIDHAGIDDAMEIISGASTTGATLRLSPNASASNPALRIDNDGSIVIDQAAAANVSAIAQLGQIWVRAPDTGEPANRMMYQDGQGIDHNLIDEFRVKLADETRLNTTTYSADGDIDIALAINAIYAVEVYLVWDADTADPDVKWQWTVPAGTTLNALSFDTTNNIVQYAEVAFTSIFTLGGAEKSHFIRMRVETGATAGNLTLEWAQFVLDAVDNTYLRRGSYIIARRLN